MNHIPFKDAVWVAQSLYDQGLVKGSAGNLSFRWNDRLYISASGSCFGRMTPENFVFLCEGGEIHGRPSKELPLHEALYQAFPDISAVIHVHSTYAVALSCLPPRDPPVPRYTPYLSMKLGAVGFVPYAPPGSQALFSLPQTFASNRKGIPSGKPRRHRHREELNGCI